MKMKKRKHRCDINRRRFKHRQKYSKYKNFDNMMILNDQFMKKLCNTEAEFKKNVPYKKSL